MRSLYGVPRFFSFLSTYHLLFIFFPMFLHLIHACNESCGSLPIPYPFSISSHCGFPSFRNYIYCSQDGTTLLQLNSQKYEVINFVAGGIVIDPLIYGNCREHDINLAGYSNFKVSSLNTVFALSGCKEFSPRSSCRNCTASLTNSVRLGNCLDISRLYCCSSTHYNSSWFQTLLRSGNCSSFTSWIERNENMQNQNESSLQYGLQLDFGLPGECPGACSSNALCNRTRLGYLCTCAGGFTGDGYQSGSGCSSIEPFASPGALSVLNPAGYRRLQRSSAEVNHSESKNSPPPPPPPPPPAPPPPCSNSAASNLPACKDELSRQSFVASGLIAGAAVFSSILIAAALVWRRNSWISRKKREQMQQLINFLSPSACSATVRFTYRELEKATKGFSPTQKLGNGAYGTVYAGRLEDGRLIAVKRIDSLGPQGLKQVANEVNVLFTVEHKNLVQFLGYCSETGDPLLVFEYVPNGTLAEHLRRERGEGLDWFTRINIATETAEALAYLHSIEPPVYHRDVKSRNILLDNDFKTKVADFGLSRLALSLGEGSHISTVPQGTPGYLDPEYHQTYRLSDKSDVYSFGVVLVEMITALSPVDFSRDKKEVNLSALAVTKIINGCLDDIIDPLLQADTNPAIRASVHRVGELAFRCLSFDKDDRPTMVEVMEELIRIRDSSTSISLEVTTSGNKDASLGDKFALKQQALSPVSVQAPWESRQSSTQGSGSSQ